ncbi:MULTISPECIES: dipeptide/oligopeptide/nickel ABC transporter permease/ATP-binding protein [unclassified Leucobacter]|uniref:dipeptide/oligopeptide/nickel ABC transporter permease/ATP-binding protein n=1 Tax=unclassified Leucobacter TaxID=2621730 RepID=UPI00165E1417|nr:MULTISPECIES: dipeptide/oligopeptide/nickel ABC transporter permease/ATP-binding protein [unclassified Leucobacter]MBC9936221.1 dipeptide/oligopeptide/nickel ABC transporter permease/ATP-binding protein [Leucobacter sp. cx-87]
MAESKKLPPTLIVGSVMMGLLVLVAIFAPIFMNEAASTLGSGSRQGPSPEHLLGTDELGRDILARTLVATRLTLIMTTSATAVAVVFGVLIGGTVWLAPRWLRNIILRTIDSTVAFPSLVLALVIAAIMGPGSFSAVVAIGVAGIPSFARLTSNMMGGIVNRDFIVTARLLGVPGHAIFSRHLLPNVAGPLLVLSTSSFSLALLEISSLSFVGLGVQNPEYDFGRLLNDGLTAIYTQPWQAIAPSIMLVYSGIAAMLIGDGLAQRLDPGLRRALKPQNPRVKSAQVDPSQSKALVVVQDLHVFAPDGSELVKGLNFEIAHGQVLGLVGESGSGKSMTAMALAGLSAEGIQVQAQTMRLDDMDLLGTVEPKKLATEIGLVFQDPGTTFNPALRMGTQLTEVARVHLGLGRREATKTLVDQLDRIHIHDPEKRMKQYPFELSGGMLQRSTIASSLVTEPKLIIADEPTTALDVTVQAEVLRQFRAINQANQTAMLFISHDIGVVQELCDVVLVMKQGEIIERLTGDQLRRHEASHPYTRKLLAATPSLDDPSPIRVVREGDKTTAHATEGVAQ